MENEKTQIKKYCKLAWSVEADVKQGLSVPTVLLLLLVLVVVVVVLLVLVVVVVVVVVVVLKGKAFL